MIHYCPPKLKDSPSMLFDIVLIILKFYVSASRMQNIALNPNDVHIFGGA